MLKLYFKGRKDLVIRINQVKNLYPLEVEILDFKQSSSFVISKYLQKEPLDAIIIKGMSINMY